MDKDRSRRDRNPRNHLRVGNKGYTTIQERNWVRVHMLYCGKVQSVLTTSKRVLKIQKLIILPLIPLFLHLLDPSSKTELCLDSLTILLTVKMSPPSRISHLLPCVLDPNLSRSKIKVELERDRYTRTDILDSHSFREKIQKLQKSLPLVNIPIFPPPFRNLQLLFLFPCL